MSVSRYEVNQFHRGGLGQANTRIKSSQSSWGVPVESCKKRNGNCAGISQKPGGGVEFRSWPLQLAPGFGIGGCACVFNSEQGLVPRISYFVLGLLL